MLFLPILGTNSLSILIHEIRIKASIDQNLQKIKIERVNDLLKQYSLTRHVHEKMSAAKYF